MTTANSASWLSEIAFSEESDRGTAETVPDVYDYMSGDPAINPVQNVIAPEKVFGRERRKTVLGSYHMEGSIPFIVEPEGFITYALKWALGDVDSSVQGGTDAYKHTFTPANAVKTFTTWLKRAGNQQVKINFCVLNRFELAQDVDDVLRATMRILGQKDAITTDFGNSSYSTLDPLSNTHLTVSLAGSTSGQAPQVYNTRVFIDNGFSVDRGKTHGSRFYTSMVAGKRTVGGSFDVYFDDDSEYQRFWGAAAATSPANTAGTVAMYFEWDSQIVADTGYNYRLKVIFPAAIYHATSVNIGGERTIQHVDFEGQYDVTATNEIEIELVNTLTTV